MPKIQILSDLIISKIAAGEVIERPMFVVKELIENAIDANASEVTIHIENAGLKKIIIIDNGQGIPAHELRLAVQPHTTSKLFSEDITGIQTLGFRGEALASIAAVSNFTIKSRTKNVAVGTQVHVFQGNIQEKNFGMQEGTIVTVENLFQEMPARKKFLKSTATEFRHIVDLVTRFCLAFPNVHFLLTHNNRTILDIPKNKTLANRIEKLFSVDFFSQLIPIHYDEGYIKISGFLAKPQLSSTTANKQFIFVNNRSVSDKLLSLAVKESYATLLGNASHPIFILSLTVPFQFVDVNVHPRKEQVNFVNSQSIFIQVKHAITETLQNNNITFQNVTWLKQEGTGATKTFAAKSLRESVLSKDSLTQISETPLAQLYKTYIFKQTPRGIIIYDQHAVHERILYEKLLEEYAKGFVLEDLHSFVTPISYSLSVVEKEIAIEKKQEFAEYGFIYTIKDRTLFLTNAPKFLYDRDMSALLKELFEEIILSDQIKKIDNISQKMIAYVACHSSVKAGDTLTLQQMEKLLAQLASTPSNATCPHGRPTQITFPLSQLQRMFKR